MFLLSGAWGGQLVDVLRKESQRPAALAQLPVQPKKRYIFNIHCDKKQMTPKQNHFEENEQNHNINIMEIENYEYGIPPPPAHTPLVIEPGGVYFRPEGQGGNYIAGASPPSNEVRK